MINDMYGDIEKFVQSVLEGAEEASLSIAGLLVHSLKKDQTNHWRRQAEELAARYEIAEALRASGRNERETHDHI